MTELEDAFLHATRAMRCLPARPDNDTLLQLYALYTQATEGDVQAPPPGFFDFVGSAKHEAWRALRGMPQADAMQRYVDLVGALSSSGTSP
jgi:acyl-CoA-binding protein